MDSQTRSILSSAVKALSKTNSGLFPVSLSRPHGVDSIHRADKDFSIAMLAGPCTSLNGSQGGVQLCLFDDNGEHDLRQLSVNGIAHLNASLLSPAKDIHLRQRNNACGFQGVNNLFFPIGSNNGANHSHS